MLITDSHAHLEMLKDLDKLIDKQKQANVKFIINQSMDLESCKKTLELSKNYDIILAAVGMYPPEKDIDKKDIKECISFIKKNIKKACAIGEVGLDYSGEQYDKQIQKYILKEMISISIKNNLPIIIHSRKAEDDVFEILSKFKHNKIIQHCFCGKKRLVDEGIKRKYYFSIPTNVVRSEQFKYIVKECDISRILTETDSPFLSPYKDGKPNEPKNIIESLKVIAEIKKMTLEETSMAIFQNFQKLFL